ncbi:DUF3892 domain-containing protein [Mycobacterium sp. M23085]|uniref:DUF3892 domain-containing protein n=1 Tax=Mycobacterium sp. M23085 TaxID=3378087 RepID=UPI003877A0FD
MNIPSGTKLTPQIPAKGNSPSTQPARTPAATRELLSGSTLESPHPSGVNAPTRARKVTPMAIRITAVRLSGGATHVHIDRVRWTDTSTGESGEGTPDDIAARIETHNDTAYVDDDDDMVSVGMVQTDAGAKHLRTHTNDVWKDHLRGWWG